MSNEEKFWLSFWSLVVTIVLLAVTSTALSEYFQYKIELTKVNQGCIVKETSATNGE